MAFTRIFNLARLASLALAAALALPVTAQPAATGQAVLLLSAGPGQDANASFADRAAPAPAEEAQAASAASEAAGSVPEPADWALLASGLLTVLWLRRRVQPR